MLKGHDGCGGLERSGNFLTRLEATPAYDLVLNSVGLSHECGRL